MFTDEDAGRLRRSLVALGLAFHRALDDADFERFEADLADIPIDRIEDACVHLRRHSKRFPTVAHIREQADLLPRRLPALPPAPLPSHPNDPPYCVSCDDTGWELGLWCDGGICGHPRAHASHSFTRKCRCRASNPVYQERQRAHRKFHHEVE